MTKRLALFVFISVAFNFSGCASIQNGKILPKVPPKGTRIVLPADGSRFFGPKLTIRNFAGKKVVIVPVSQGRAYAAKYELGDKSPWCLWLCREKKVTGYFAVCNGMSLTVPLVETTDGYYDRRMSLELYVYENNRLIGSYFYCVINPLYRNEVQNVVFDRETLQEMKSGRYGEICQRYRQYW